MHVIFIPYGIKEKVDLLIRDMQCQKFQLRLFKEGQPDKFIWMQGSLRRLPFGVYEYVFPKEYLYHVLTTLNFHVVSYPQYQGIKLKFCLSFLRKFLMAEKVPQFKTENQMIWMNEHVAIIPIGIRKDADLIEPEGKELAGWTHEAI